MTPCCPGIPNPRAATRDCTTSGTHRAEGRGAWSVLGPSGHAVELGPGVAPEQAPVGVGGRAALVDHGVDLLGDRHVHAVAVGHLDHHPGGLDPLGHHLHLGHDVVD